MPLSQACTDKFDVHSLSQDGPRQPSAHGDSGAGWPSGLAGARAAATGPVGAGSAAAGSAGARSAAARLAGARSAAARPARAWSAAAGPAGTRAALTRPVAAGSATARSAGTGAAVARLVGARSATARSAAATRSDHSRSDTASAPIRGHALLTGQGMAGPPAGWREEPAQSGAARKAGSRQQRWSAEADRHAPPRWADTAGGRRPAVEQQGGERHELRGVCERRRAVDDGGGRADSDGTLTVSRLRSLAQTPASPTSGHLSWWHHQLRQRAPAPEPPGALSAQQQHAAATGAQAPPPQATPAAKEAAGAAGGV